MTTSTTALREARDQLRTLRTSYEQAVADFSWPDVGASFNFGHDWFDAFARGNQGPGLVIVEEDGTRASFSFDELATRSDQVAAHLVAQGIGRGDSVVVMLGNQVELWESMLALIKLGAVLMPTTTAVGSAELVDRMTRGGARAVICNAADAWKFDDVPGDYVRVVVGATSGAWVDYAAAYDVAADRARQTVVHPMNASDDRLLLYFTSGTTSRPKLVEHTHVSYPVGHLSTMYWLGLQAGDVHLNISSPGWAKHAWSNFFAPWLAEATVFVYNYSRFDPVALMEQIRAEGVTTFCAPPTVWRMLINADLSEGPGRLREAIAAGEPLNPEVISQVEKRWGLTIRDGFGQTEMTAAIANSPGQPVTSGSMGRPLPGVPVTLVDPVTGEAVEGVGEGEICLDLGQAPLTLMTGYQGDPERNADAMAGGWYHTGDVATRDEQGYITYVGRTDDVFKASDYKVSPFELESVLIEHPAVAEAAVVPAPDPVRLAVPKAYVALAPGFAPDAETARSILTYAREHLPPYLRVRRLEFYELPKTISGKIRRVDLRQRENAIEGERPSGEFRDDDLVATTA
ncbi:MULTISPECIES: AMP-binding protein [unclassified Nocardioides]|uniref:AMP-binding protein n=1 Tax=unclassified Nocardioides TaxID=2615069 RepID=UPI0006FA251D|nr:MULTISPECIES: AMP-binding protein [unclassified Nocardioides]KRA29855.1 AMP-dependent synthetase [Nocardioides sp. Root614]KRA86778.1 AMP-dependent synthetase [Nocardioides sp. Root682]